MVKQLRQKLSRRPDLTAIADILPQEVRVLDLGCGDGSFLKLLNVEKKIKGVGLELDQDKIIESIENGINVIQADLNDGLQFDDDVFDFVVLSQTLQAVNRPDRLLQEMLRVGRKGIVSFINIGYYKARFQLTFKGTMPETKTLPHRWYDTPNIHLGTIKDFRSLCEHTSIKIVKEIPLAGKNKFLARFAPNLFALTCVFVIARD
jgi:methionine biosynthesis protein MetW